MKLLATRLSALQVKMNVREHVLVIGMLLPTERRLQTYLQITTNRLRYHLVRRAWQKGERFLIIALFKTCHCQIQ